MAWNQINDKKPELIYVEDHYVDGDSESGPDVQLVQVKSSEPVLAVLHPSEDVFQLSNAAIYTHQPHTDEYYWVVDEEEIEITENDLWQTIKN